MNRQLFFAPALEVAPQLLGARLTVRDPNGQPVTARITEVEAYHGVGVPGPYDAGSHSRNKKTERNASMFGPPGHAYVYLSYGIHFALNMVCSPEGSASGVLIRSGEIIEGHTIAAARRSRAKSSVPGRSRGMTDPAMTDLTMADAPTSNDASDRSHERSRDRNLARGPGNLASALGITRALHDGHDLFQQPFELTLPNNRAAIEVSCGPRVGVSGEAGGPAFPWRFWVSGDPSVSAYRPGRNVPRAVPAKIIAPS